jgi:uncharacterized protein YlzI (FlbEa/FlbD family)
MPVMPKKEASMIFVTRLDDSHMLVNVEKIKSVCSTPDTVITFTDDDHMMVREGLEELNERIIDYKRAIACESMVPAAVITRREKVMN